MKKMIIIAMAAIMGFVKAEAQSRKTPCASPNTSFSYADQRSATRVVPAAYYVPRSASTGTFASRSKFTWSDNMHNPYEGKPSQQNDGPRKNEMRNLNFTITATGRGDLPPNDGAK